MWKRVAAVFVVAFSLFSVLSVGAQERSVYWERWDVLIDNVDTTENVFDVTEIYDLTFNGTFRFGTATIPTSRLTDIRNVSLVEDGRALRSDCSGGQAQGTFCAIELNNEVSITYIFRQPVTNGGKLIELSYTVYGALRVYEGGDQLWWDAVPEEHYGFPIGSSTITVQLPEGFAPREGVDPVLTYGAPGNVQVNGTRVVAKAQREIGGDEGFSIRVQYPHDPNATVPVWQSGFDQQRDFEENVEPLINLAVLAISLLIAGGGILLIYVRWQTKGRDPSVGPVPTYLTEPPSDLPPAVVGTLIDETADVRDVISTLLDLAKRGYLVIEESKAEGFLGMGGSSSFTFKRTDKSFDDLRPFETRLVNSIFGSERMERTLDSLRNRFYSVIPQIQNDLYQEVMTRKLFTANPNTTRSAWAGLGILLMVLGGVGLFVLGALVENIGFIAFCLPASLFLVGAVAISFGQAMPAKTREGALEAEKWRAFLEYLRNLEKYAGLTEAASQFDVYLPYAVAFGIDRLWINRFRRVDNVPIPPWYFPTYLGGPYRRGYMAGTPWRGTGMGTPSVPGLPGEIARAGGGGLDDLSGGLSQGLESLSNGLTTMLNTTSSVLTSRPQQTSSGSGSWSSGGRSFSGGGFSGGGGSGGGSRGFG
jgi:uncharacterized membrane protein YgcG